MKRLILLIAALISLSIQYDMASAETGKKVTLFPFNDLSSSALDMKSSSIIAEELAKNGAVELIPSEVVREEILAVEPEFLWTGSRGKRGGGGILWRIQPTIVERVSRGLNSDYSIFGDISRSDDKWEVSVSITDSDAVPIRVFTIRGKSRDEMPKKLSALGRDISRFFTRENIVESAEEEVRRYLGRLDSLQAAVAKIESMSASYPDSLPLRAILLDLYMRDKDVYMQKIIPSATRIIDIYDPANQRDTAYLLSRYLDPYDILAEQYEMQGNIKKAIEIRQRALRDFPYFSAGHKKAIETLKGKLE